MCERKRPTRKIKTKYLIFIFGENKIKMNDHDACWKERKRHNTSGTSTCVVVAVDGYGVV